MRNKKLFLGIFIFAFLIVLVAVFCVPFLLSHRGINEDHAQKQVFTEMQQYYENIPKDELCTLKDDATNIKISSYAAQISEQTLKVISTNTDIPIKTDWNETPYDIINEKSSTTLYNIGLYNDNDELDVKELPYKIEIPVPKNFEKEQIKVFRRTGENSFEYLYSAINNSKIILYTKSLGEFAIVSDAENIAKTSYLAIKGISLKYENILTLKVFANMFTPEYSEAYILMWTKEQDEYSIDNATTKNKYSGDNIFELTNIEFKNIDDTIYMKICVKTDKGYLYSPLIEYNILQYCINLYNSNESKEVKNLILGTICYSQVSNDYEGRKSDIFDKFALACNYKSSCLATVNSIEFKGENLYSETGTSYFYGRNVDMNNKIHYNIYVKNEVEGIENLFLLIKINQKEYKVPFTQDKAYGFYKATFTEIQPYDINTPIFLQIVDKNGKQIGGTLTDSVGTFINEGQSEYVLEKDKNMFAATIYFMSVCENMFKKV